MVSPCYRAKVFPTAALSTSGIRVEGHTFLSACLANDFAASSPAFSVVKIKTGDNPSGASCKKSLCMTSYGGIIRIRLRVEGHTFLSACLANDFAASSPVFIGFIIRLFLWNYKRILQISNRFMRHRQKCSSYIMLFMIQSSRIFRACSAQPLLSS